MQQFVSDLMAERVIDAPEVVHVDVQQGNLLLFTLCLGHRAV